MSRRILDAAEILRAAGLRVVEVSGWEQRAYRGGSTPDGALDGLGGGLAHHTATPSTVPGNLPTLALLLAGRRDVPGPLSQFALARDGTWYVLAAGRANHSGAVDDLAYSNRYAIGVEAEHAGGREPWPAEQYAAYVAGCAALGRAYGIKWRGHKEAATPRGRKVDPNFPMQQFRADVANWRPPANRKDRPEGEEEVTPIIAYLFSAKSADGKTHLYCGFPTTSRTVEHMGSTSEIEDVKHVLNRVGYSVAEWGSEVANTAVFGQYVGPEGARPKVSQ